MSAIINIETILSGSESGNLVLSYLGSIYDIKSLGLASKSMNLYFDKKHHYKKIITTNLENIVKKYDFTDLKMFNDFLLLYNLVLSGSTTLTMLGSATSDSCWISNDLDLYCHFHKYDIMKSITIYLRNIGYICSLSPKFENYQNSRCFTFTKYRGEKLDSKIQIINVADPIVDIVKMFHLNFLSNIYYPIDGGKFVCLSPISVVTRCCFLNYTTIIKIYFTMRYRPTASLKQSISDQILKNTNRIYKYQARGFTIIGDIPSLDVLTNICNLHLEFQRLKMVPKNFYCNVMFKLKKMIDCD